MSPNLSSKHFAGNRLLYEQVIYNVLRLVGVARPGSKSFTMYSGQKVFVISLMLHFVQHIKHFVVKGRP